jgi:hypothetical protein
MNVIQTIINVLINIAHKLMEVGPNTEFSKIEIGKWTILIDKIFDAFKNEQLQINKLKKSLTTELEPLEKFRIGVSLERRENRLKELKNKIKILKNPSVMGGTLDDTTKQIKKKPDTTFQSNIEPHEEEITVNGFEMTV